MTSCNNVGGSGLVAALPPPSHYPTPLIAVISTGGEKSVL